MQTEDARLAKVSSSCSHPFSQVEDPVNLAAYIESKMGSLELEELRKRNKDKVSLVTLTHLLLADSPSLTCSFPH